MIVIMFENHAYSQVIGHAGYFDDLARACGIATNYWAVSHPSLPNYLAVTSGATHVSTDCAPADCPQHGLSIFSQVAARHLIWHSYNESMPHACSGAQTSLYTPNHNPAAYYTDVHGLCLTGHDVRLGTTTGGPLYGALHGTLGGYVMVAPNLCDDMHNCSVASGDAWLAKWMPMMRRSPVYQAGHTAIVVTFDEGSGTNHVVTIVVSPYVHPGTRVTRYFNHYSLLRASEYALGIYSFLGNAANPRIGGFATAFHMR